METLFLDKGVDPVQVQARLEEAAREVGLPFGKRERTYNSRLAQELGKWAESEGRGDAFHDIMYRACLVDGKNISDISVLVELAGALGLSEKRAEEVLEKRLFQTSVDLDWERSRAMRIRVAPTFVINNRWLVGAQKYEKMARFLKANHVKELESSNT
jgi:predicted DsbA family dithiol-disulfide isomerase